ncbi:MAG: hypothetical protein Q7S12_03975 [bacterium]|nr:hypothetical protein [bacterium]
MLKIFAWGLIALFSLGLPLAVGGEELSETIYKKYGVEVEIFSDNTAENDEWLLAIKTALGLLSASDKVSANVIKHDNRVLKFFLKKDPNDWGSGSYDAGEHSITINTTPKLVDLFGGGHMGENGFLRSSKLYIVIHELGHAYDFSNRNDPSISLLILLINKDSDSQKQNARVFAEALMEAPPTKYPFIFCDANFSFIEDFAESFVLYVAWPDILKNNFPKRYAFLKEKFQTEFKGRGGIMPRTLQARLFKKNEEIKCMYSDSIIE